MKRVLGCWVLGCWVLGCWVLAPAPTLHAQSRIANAVTETRAASASLDGDVRTVAGRGAPAWMGYRVPVAAGDLRLCDAPTHLEPATELLVLARLEGGAIERLRLFTPDCELDLGGLPLVMLSGVTADASVAWLDGLARAGSTDTRWRSRVARPALTALGLHGTAAASNALIAIARADGPTWMRREAVQWLARSREPRATAFFEQILR